MRGGEFLVNNVGRGEATRSSIPEGSGTKSLEDKPSVIVFPNVFPVQITANVSIKPSARRLQIAASSAILPFSGSGILPHSLAGGGEGMDHHQFLQPFSDSATSFVDHSVSAP